MLHAVIFAFFAILPIAVIAAFTAYMVREMNSEETSIKSTHLAALKTAHQIL